MCVELIGEDKWTPEMTTLINHVKAVFEEKKRHGDVLDYAAYSPDDHQRAEYGITGNLTVMFGVNLDHEHTPADTLFTQELWAEVVKRNWETPPTKEEIDALGITFTIQGPVKSVVTE